MKRTSPVEINIQAVSPEEIASSWAAKTSGTRTRRRRRRTLGTARRAGTVDSEANLRPDPPKRVVLLMDTPLEAVDSGRTMG
jgi:hypothetical protein